MSHADNPAPDWIPSPERIASSKIRRYTDWLERERGLKFADFDALWRWSVNDIAAFWGTLWDYFDIRASAPYREVITERKMPGAHWFPGAELNFVDQVFRHARSDRPAVLYADEQSEVRSLSWDDLRARVAAMAGHLRSQGIKPGERVVAYVPNTPEALIAFLATASVGATWSVCSPDMGVRAVLDRFQQIQPKALFAVSSFAYGGKTHDRDAELTNLVSQLPSLRHVIHVAGPLDNTALRVPSGVTCTSWAEALRAPADTRTEAVPFEHPLWVVYSSGTTGLPKAIVHGHGGIMMESLKMLTLHADLGPEDTFFWYSSTNWVMWNVQIAGLLFGATIAIYDGNPAWPDMGALWRFAGKAKVTFFGAGAAFFAGCQKAGIAPKSEGDFSALRTIGSTGSPLSPESYAWLAEQFGKNVWLNPMSGGTDLAGAFVAGLVTLPVYFGEMQCRCLGADVHAYDEAGKELIDEVGELVCASPMPSMPLYLWNDKDGVRYRDSYFDVYPGVWRHGDWIRITPRGGAIIYGRSDATINRYGLRLGTSEIYRAVEELPEVLDSMVIDMEYLGRESYMPLFVALRPGITLDAALKERIVQSIRKGVSPRFVPNEIFQVPEIPRTLSGKKLEVPVKKIFLGQPVDKVLNRDAIANANALSWYVEFAERLPKTQAPGKPA